MNDSPFTPARTASDSRSDLDSSARPPRRGLFVSFEGGDGAGKSTQIRLLQEHLIRDREVSEDLITVTREPGGTGLGERIRELLLDGEEIDTRAEALLYAADRAHHVHTVIRPHLARGGMVLADRYLDSSIAYQGAGRNLDPSDIAAISRWATHGLLPHRTILLDLPVAALAQRRQHREEDRLERAGMEFHESVRAQFLALAEAEPDRFTVIDGSLPSEQVHELVRESITELMNLFDPSQPTSEHRQDRE